MTNPAAPLLSGWRRAWTAGTLSALCCLVFQPTAAHALQPLQTFLRGVADHPEQQEASAESRRRDSEEKVATARLFPSLEIEGSYTRNQYEREFVFPGSSEPLPFMPLNQLDAAITLTVPLINVAAWEQRGTSQALGELSKAQVGAVRQDLEGRVVQAYYQLLGSSAVRRAAERYLRIAKDNLGLVLDKSKAGTATQLDVERARSEVALAEQELTSVRLSESIAARKLGTLTGVEPEPVRSFPSDALTPVAPLSHYTATTESTPMMEAARASSELVERKAKATRAPWYPTLTGIAQERFTNATALVGHEAYYLFQIKAAWKFEFQNLHTTDASNEEVKAAHAREESKRQQLGDAVFSAWNQVRSGIEKAKSAREQAGAAARALRIARMQYEAGVVTQLEVLAAQRSAFSGDVARIRADADLSYAREMLRVLTGREPGER